MADINDKYPENVEGSYYVDESCIACGVCVSTAPDNFKFTSGDKYAFVYKQPEGDEEVEASSEALEACPVDAIGDDG